MSPKNQTQSLIDLSLKAFESYLECVYLELLGIVCEFCKRDENLGYGFLRTSNLHLGKHLFENVPHNLLDSIVECVVKLLPKLAVEVRETFGKCFCIETFVTKMNTIVLFTTILLHPRIQFIDIARLPSPMKHVLLRDLHKMSGLKILELGAGSRGLEISETEEKILRGLTCMSQLVQLHLEIDCTDTIIKCVSTNCKQLQVLNIPNSKSVTQRCVPYLSQMKTLKHLCVTYTQINGMGYSTLLCELPMLTNIGFCNYASEVFVNITTLQNNKDSGIQSMEDKVNYKILNLENLGCSTLYPSPLKEISHIQSKEDKIYKRVLNLTNLGCSALYPSCLKMLIELCPKLVKLVLQNVEELDISPLQQLKNLKYLTLVNGNLDKVNLLSYLSNYHELECLYLKRIDRINKFYLMQISDNCPRLKIFYIDSCEFNTPGGSPETQKTHKYFSRLEKFSCDNSLESKDLDIILNSCYNIENINLGGRTLLSDRAIEHIFSHNPMKNLKEFKIIHCLHLTMKSVYMLIEHCPNLTVILQLETWPLISKKELVQLKDYIKVNNLNLTLAKNVFQPH